MLYIGVAVLMFLPELESLHVHALQHEQHFCESAQLAACDQDQQHVLEFLVLLYLQLEVHHHAYSTVFVVPYFKVTV